MTGITPGGILFRLVLTHPGKAAMFYAQQYYSTTRIHPLEIGYILQQLEELEQAGVVWCERARPGHLQEMPVIPWLWWPGAPGTPPEPAQVLRTPQK